MRPTEIAVPGSFGVVVEGLFLPFAPTLSEEDADWFFAGLLESTTTSRDQPGREYITALVAGARRIAYHVTVDEDGRARMRLIEGSVPDPYGFTAIEHDAVRLSPAVRKFLDAVAVLMVRDLLEETM